MSAVLTAVNLLPLLPLDGGRAMHAVFSDCAHAEMLMKRIRFCFLALLLLCGGYGTAAGWGPALLLFALWLAIVPEAPTALAKQRRLL
jgi:Zn-dependent protease